MMECHYQYFYHIVCPQMIKASSQTNKNHNAHTHTTAPLFTAAQLEQKNVHTLKTAFNQWIRSLPMEERFLALKIYSAPIPQILRKALANLEPFCQERGSEIQPGKTEQSAKGENNNDSRKFSRKMQKGFCQSLVLISDGHGFLDHICFEFGLLECPEKLYDLLTSPLENTQIYPVKAVVENRDEISVVVNKLLASTNLEGIARVTLNYLRQEILLRFRESMINREFLAKGLEEERRFKKDFSIHLKYLSQDLKKRMVLLGFQHPQELQHWLISQNINLNCFGLQEQITELLKLEKNQFSNRIFKCKLKKAHSETINYYEQIYFYWKREVTKNKKKRFSRKTSPQKIEQVAEYYIQGQDNERVNQHKRKKLKHKKSLSAESIETNVTDGDKRVLKRKTQAEQQLLLPNQSSIEINNTEQSVEIPFLEPEKKKLYKKRKNGDEKREPKFLKSENRKGRISPHEQTKPKSPSSSDSGEESILQIIKKIPTNAHEMKELSISLITEELQEFADKVSEEANLYHGRRMVAFERIQFLLSFYYVQIELFGSCASGIAIQSSDIDIAVKPEILNYFEHVPEHLRLQAALENLQQIFSTQPYISDIRVIGTASVPIIKLKIDTSVPCLDSSYGEVFASLNRPHRSGLIQTDITIETLNLQKNSSHLGISSTQLIKQWLQQIPTLHCVALTLKYLLQRRGLNITYEGGLNTFSMMLLVVAYIYHAKLVNELNPAIVLEHVLRFYAYQFNQKQTGIDILHLNKQHTFFSKSQARNGEQKTNESFPKADLEVIDPNSTQRNITRRCYKFPQIKEFFREILSRCFEKSLQEVSDLVKKVVFESESKRQNLKAKELKEKNNRFSQLLGSK